MGRVEAAGLNNQTISFNPWPDRLVGYTPFGVNAMASSGLPHIGTLLAPAICAVSRNTLISTGTRTIQTAYVGTTSVNPASPATEASCKSSCRR